jgi:gamma-glutamyltranspeptidase
MPTVSPTFDFVQVQTNRVPRVSWLELATGDTINSLPVTGRDLIHGAVQFTGTFGSATVKLQVSNDNTTFIDLKDTAGNAISVTAAGFREFSTAGLFVRPAISGGTNDAVNVIVSLRN